MVMQHFRKGLTWFGVNFLHVLVLVACPLAAGQMCVDCLPKLKGSPLRCFEKGNASFGCFAVTCQDHRYSVSPNIQQDQTVFCMDAGTWVMFSASANGSALMVRCIPVEEACPQEKSLSETGPNLVLILSCVIPALSLLCSVCLFLMVCIWRRQTCPAGKKEVVTVSPSGRMARPGLQPTRWRPGSFCSSDVGLPSGSGCCHLNAVQPPAVLVWPPTPEVSKKPHTDLEASICSDIQLDLVDEQPPTLISVTPT